MADESRSLIPRTSRHARAWRATALSLAGSASFLFAIGLVLAASGAPTAPGLAWRAALFTLCAVAFFVAHEGGHVLAARANGVAADPPWFLPVGAVLRLREAPDTRGALAEIGAWGPIAGAIALALLLLVRLALGAPPPPPEGLPLGAPALWWVVALPLGAGPPSGADPVAAAFCLGCLVTALNLVPFGQLDGGHVVSALWPRRALPVGWVATGALLLGGLVWPGFAVWAAVIHLAGSRMPLRARRESTPPDRRARASSAAALVVFLLCVSPSPVG